MNYHRNHFGVVLLLHAMDSYGARLHVQLDHQDESVLYTFCPEYFGGIAPNH